MNWMGFREFTYDSILPACLVAPLKPSFDLNDGQCFLVSTGQFIVYFSFIAGSFYPLMLQQGLLKIV